MELGKFFLYKAVGTLVVISIVLIVFLIAKNASLPSKTSESPQSENKVNGTSTDDISTE